MTVGVVVTTWNDAHYLDRCLGSILGQTRRPDQVVVVNDGSTERLEDLAAAERRFPHVRFVHQANAGPSAARNRGVRETTAEFVAFVDADDWLDPDCLRVRAERLEREPTLVGAYGGFTALHPDGRRTRSRFGEHAGWLHARLFGRPGGVPAGLPLWLFRSDAWSALGGLDTKLRIYEDMDALIRLSRLGPLAGANEPMYMRNLRPNSLSRASQRRRLAGSFKFLAKARAGGYFTTTQLARFHLRSVLSFGRGSFLARTKRRSSSMSASVPMRMARLASRLPRIGFRLVRAIAGLSGERMTTVETRFGPTMTVDVTEGACYSVFKRGYNRNSREDEQFYARTLKRDDVVFDVGANIGYTLVQFAPKVEKVVAYEPSPRAYALLSATAEQFDNVILRHTAVGDQEGSIAFSEEADLSVSSVGSGDLKVPVVVLDDEVAALGLVPTFVKIDVEGHEPAVLRGAMRLLARGPRVFFEALSDEALAEATAVLVAANPAYSVERIAPGNRNFIATAAR